MKDGGEQSPTRNPRKIWNLEQHCNNVENKESRRIQLTLRLANRIRDRLAIRAPGSILPSYVSQCVPTPNKPRSLQFLMRDPQSVQDVEKPGSVVSPDRSSSLRSDREDTSEALEKSDLEDHPTGRQSS